MGPSFHVRDWTIRRKIVLLLIASSTLPLAVAAVIAFRAQRQMIVQNTTDLLSARGDQIADELDAFHGDYLRAIGRLSKFPAVLQYAQSAPISRGNALPSAAAMLDIWKNSDPAFRGIGILDPTGTVLLATEKGLIGRDLSFYRHVRQALSGSEIVSGIHISGPETSSIPTIAYMAPIKDGRGKVLGTAALWVNASAFWDIIQAWNEKAGSGSFSVLFDQHGVRIGHSYNRDILFRPGGALSPAHVAEMSAEKRFGEKTREILEDVRAFPEQFDRSRSVSPPDPEMFRGFAPVNRQWNFGVPRRLKTVPWTLFYMIPEKSLQAPLSALTRRMAFLSVLIIILAFGAGMMFAEGIIKPIKGLTAAVSAMDLGRLDARARVDGRDELGNLAANFNAMAERLESLIESEKQANKELEAFSYSVSHDLRAPLRSIDGFSRILLEDYAPKLDAEAHRLLGVVRSNTQRMGQLIDDLLSFSKIAKQALRRAPIDMTAMTRKAYDELQAGQPKKVEFTLDELPPAHGDPAMIRQVWTNLLSNALKYSGRNARAHVTVGGRRDDDTLHYWVKDNGAGFDMRYVDKLFGVFQRLHRPDEFDGTGVGLAIVQRIVAKHGGQVRAEGSLGQGATFHFTLPMENE